MWFEPSCTPHATQSVHDVITETIPPRDTRETLFGTNIKQKP